MKTKLACLLIAVMLTVGGAGCSTVATSTGPMIYRLEDGEKSVGELAKHQISGSIYAGVIVLEKTPVCPIVAEKVRIAQKQRRGRVFSMVEVVIFGLGFYDAAKSQAVVENSKEIKPLGKYETGEFVPCGEKKPAAHETVIITDKQQTMERQAQTDGAGRLDLKAVLGAPDHVMHLAVRLASDPEDALTVIYRPER